MHTNETTTMSCEYTVNRVIVDYDAKSFIVHIKDYQPVEILFLEVESFIYEYDEKLHNYLEGKEFKTLAHKIYEAVDIGYDFTPMVSELLRSFIEYGLITPSKM